MYNIKKLEIKMQTHHLQHPTQPIDALLGAYAAGHLSQPLHVLMQSHLELQPQSQPFVAALEASAARKIVDCDPSKLDLQRRDNRLNAIFATAEPAPIQVQPNAFMPQALQNYLNKPFQDLRWRWMMPGLKQYTIENNNDYEATLLWVKAGRKMPSHTHDGAETVLVLKGSFADNNGQFERGDVAIADAQVHHSPRAGTKEDCICFIVTDAPLRLTGRFAQFFHKFMGH